jgi:hypothetical protein
MSIKSTIGLTVSAAALAMLNLGASAVAANTPTPTSVTVAGSLQSEVGCAGDWDPTCAAAYLAFDAADEVWQGTFSLPAGNWEYKAALNDSWTENYGANAQLNGSNIGLNLAGAQSVKFYYDHATHWIADNKGNVIATVPGSFQSELGCPGDWQPDCLRSWLQDPDGDGTYAFTTTALPAGNYEGKVAIDESWTENYGAGGVPNGANIAFTVAFDHQQVTFSYDATTHILTISLSDQPASVTIAGSLQSEAGCVGDWDPTCAATHLAFDAADKVWQGTFNLPAGNYEYRAALNNSWNENYGANAQLNGPNVGFSLGYARDVKFYYDHTSHWVTDNVSSVIATVPGSYQSELGCPGDWQPDCLLSWLQDIEGDGIYWFSTTSLPAGNYEAKVAIDESWTVNYGAGGVPNGANLSFIVPNDNDQVLFRWNAETKILTISVNGSDTDFDFEGFFAPVLNEPAINSAKAGAGIPVKFDLGGDQGLAIFAAGYPKSNPVACDASAPIGAVEETVSAGGSRLVYDTDSSQYIYVWKTTPAWAGTCRELVLGFTDGSVERAMFRFRK